MVEVFEIDEDRFVVLGRKGIPLASIFKDTLFHCSMELHISLSNFGLTATTNPPPMPPSGNTPIQHGTFQSLSAIRGNQYVPIDDYIAVFSLCRQNLNFVAVSQIAIKAHHTSTTFNRRNFRNILSNKMTYIQKGAILHNRFQVETHAGAFNGERCLYAIDLQENQQVTLKAFLPEDPRIHAHIEFFQECGGMQGIPQFIDHFSTLGSEFIAHSHKGVRLRSILNSRLFHISMENTIRLGYRLFRILHSVHLKGFLHRDIRPLTITCDVDQNEELGVNLSYFGHAARIDTPPANNPVILGPYQSLHVSRGGAYSRIDDYISIIIVMLTCQGVNPFDFNTNSHLNHIQKKENFHADPYSFLTPETAWLGDLYLQLVEMRADRFSHLQIMAALRRAVPGIDPQTVITYHNDPANGYLLID
ncbi:hypothetical protein L5515_019673 [Caenorhabditis briggsae]|uniref:Protein kinase domain-containing protein n=1 Tax=Caenorhabditis briggsae TaxID=6238 RepID=A0AAE9FJH6_CAEBR|nr:hypothetical protein L5515_019673 [Caenorhabditis briggsae]